MNTLLKPLTAGFKLGVAVRRAAYRQGWLRTRQLNRPVISVGNLTVGGTGKTPLVADIAERLVRRGWKPAILTRGYGRRLGPKLTALEPRPARAANPREVGDEPALLARAAPEVPLVICADRYRAGLVAEERFGVNVHILDDGFQHLALARDVDVVLIDVTQKFSDDALLPAGPLREPCSALERAHLVVLTRMELGDRLAIEERVRRINPQAKIFHSSTKLCGLVDVTTGNLYPPEACQGEPLYAFCGIGNPRAFFADLRKWGLSVVDQLSFRDHYVYTEASLEMLGTLSHLLKSRPAAFVTTEKDAMNLSRLPKIKPVLPILACVVEAEIREGDDFEKELLARLEASRGPRPASPLPRTESPED